MRMKWNQHPEASQRQHLPVKCDMEFSSTIQPRYSGFTHSQDASPIRCKVIIPPQFKSSPCGPGRPGSVDRASACRLKGPRFDSSQGHMPGLRAGSPVGGRAGGSQSMILSHH
ncbi:unnamed protein product [Pipistrellus nathusii]|uniref:Uncharacterized protein n=1 Tax=Pipistrellus nathusii TaxID=59473 RepID=A0ABN9ZKL0_PIPNA